MFSTIRSKFFPGSVVEKEDVEIMEEEEDETQQHPLEYILGDPLYETMVFGGIVLKKFRARASRFIPNVTGWAYNRNIDESHVENIKECVLSMEYPHLIGSFKIVCSNDGTQPPKLLDGHHRKMAIERLLHENDVFDMDVDVDVYYIDDVENDNMVRDLFIKANNNRNVNPSDIPDILVMMVVDKMLQKWPKNIKVDERKGARRPNITKRDLVKHLKSVLSDERHSVDDADQIFHKIVIINNGIRLMPLKDLFGTNNPSDRKINSWNRASENNFFLNLDCRRSIDVWVKEI